MTPPAWLREVEEKMVKLLSLEAGWDSYGAAQICPLQVVAAIALLRRIVKEVGTSRPSVVPTSKGGVQLEWHEQGYDIEIETKGDNAFCVDCEKDGVMVCSRVTDDPIYYRISKILASFSGESND